MGMFRGMINILSHSTDGRNNMEYKIFRHVQKVVFLVEKAMEEGEKAIV